MLKIGLTGPSGSGKTTIANFITQEVRKELTFIPGSAGLMHYPESKNILEEKYGYLGQGHKAVINLSNSNPEFGYDFQFMLLKARREALTKNINFVTDRTPIDNLAYFLMQCSHNQTESVTKDYIEYAQEAFTQLTHLFILKPNENWTEMNGSRVANNYYQHMTYGVFINTYKRYFEDIAQDFRIRVVIIDDWNLDYRKAVVKHNLT